MPESDLILQAFLVHNINLTPARLKLILAIYPNLSDALADNFSLLISTLRDVIQDRIKQNTLVSNKELDTETIDISDLRQSFQHQFSSKWLSKLSQFNSIHKAEDRNKFEQTLKKDQIQILGFDQFPTPWKTLSDAPLIMFYQGEQQALYHSAFISIVGSRDPQIYTEKIMSRIMAGLQGSPVRIVSGLALGVDTIAHQHSLKYGLKCVGIIGSGIDDANFYPSSNLKLKRQILENGGIVCSEYAPGVKSLPYYFPQRNRFIASLGDFTWVVQARLKSGSLITAGQALECGKNVATTPASILDSDYFGNLKLLQEGAQIVTSAEDLLNLLEINHPEMTVKPLKQDPQHYINTPIQFSSPVAEKIYHKLSHTPQSLQDIVLQTQITAQELSTELTILELQGHATNIGQNMWIKIE